MRKTIINIQILRFIAAFMVLFSHLQHEIVSRGLSKADYRFQPFSPIFWAGGVDIFFIVSGFIMYYLSSRRFGEPTYPVKFISRRVARIAPPYWFFSALMLCALLLLKEHISHNVLDWKQILASFVFVPWPNPYGSAEPILILGWTLNFEMLFYIAFYLVLHLKKKAALGVLFVTFLAAAFIRGILFPKPVISVLSISSDPIILEFLLGIILAAVYETGLRWSGVFGCLIFAAGFCIMAILKALGLTEHDWLLRPVWMGLPALVACSGLVLINRRNKPSLISRGLAFGGDISYALYLSHPFSLNLLLLVVGTRWMIQAPWLYLWVACSVSVGTAVLVYFFIERPLTNWFGRVVFSIRRAEPDHTNNDNINACSGGT